jgi:hypothetical protein
MEDDPTVSVYVHAVVNSHYAINVAKKCLQNLLQIIAWQASFDDKASIPVLKSNELRPMPEMTAVV